MRGNGAFYLYPKAKYNWKPNIGQKIRVHHTIFNRPKLNEIVTVLSLTGFNRARIQCEDGMTFNFPIAWLSKNLEIYDSIPENDSSKI